jgi:AAA family ATP:ADP antiporter
MGANVALIFSGQYVRWVSGLRATLAPGVDPWTVSLRYLMGAVVASGGVLVATYAWMQKNVVPYLDSTIAKAAAPKKPKRPKMSLADSTKFLLKSPYIRNLAVLVISYGMCINLVEVSWKAKIKLAFPNPNDYSAFMGNFSSCMGSVTLIMMLIGRSIFQRFGWRTAALVTPTVRAFGELFKTLNAGWCVSLAYWCVFVTHMPSFAYVYMIR